MMLPMPQSILFSSNMCKLCLEEINMAEDVTGLNTSCSAGRQIKLNLNNYLHKNKYSKWNMIYSYLSPNSLMLNLIIHFKVSPKKEH